MLFSSIMKIQNFLQRPACSVILFRFRLVMAIFNTSSYFITSSVVESRKISIQANAVIVIFDEFYCRYYL